MVATISRSSDTLLPAKGSNHSSLGILVVDDDEGMRAVLDMVLSMHGFQVFLASGGTEALEVFSRERQGIAAVLLDLHMKGMSGPQLFEKMQQIDPEVPCVFMSGDLGCYNQNNLLQRGAKRFLKKPLNLKEIPQLLRGLTAL